MDNQYLYGTITDNQSLSLDKIFNSQFPAEYLQELYDIAGKSISDLSDKDGFLIYCNEDKLKDDVEKKYIFTLSGKDLRTYNIAGFVGTKNTFLSIRSRFAKKDHDDYFLHYMLQKVLNINLTNLEHSTQHHDALDFLPYLFQYYLQQALSQGLYKKYVWNEYNDSKIKGNIDIARHIKHNYIFTGNIAYNVREHSYDNNINQLIRHTIEYINEQDRYRMMLESPYMEPLVQDIRTITPSYSEKARHTVINKNLKADIHPYYSEYEPLRQICLQILLDDDKLKYGREENKIYGILFDVAWLWEEYLNTLISDIDSSFIHTYNKSRKNPIYMLKYGKDLKTTGWQAFPDYYSKELKIVMDAKYKYAQGINEVGSDDRMQIISYMHILGSKIGVFLQPSECENKVTCSELNLYGLTDMKERIYQYSFKIPQDGIKNMEDFQGQITKSEKLFIRYWKLNIKRINAYSKLK